MDLSLYIRELIMVHECIILPDFGGFETSYLPARYDKVKKRMLPPGKNVTFRIDYQKGGEILENHLVAHLKIKSVEARKIINEYVAGIKNQLQNSRESVINGVGTFKKPLSGELVFESFSDENYLADSFGLESLPLIIDEPMHELTADSASKPPQLKETGIFVYKRSNTLSFVIVGSVIICILMTVAIVLASKFDVKIFHFFGDSKNDEVIIFGGQLKTDSLTKVIDKKIEDNTSLKRALSYTDKQTVIADTKKETIYTNFLLAGSFKSIKNANELNKKLVTDGFSSEVLEIEGFYRVCLGKFVDKDSALLELQRIRKQINRSVWLYTPN